jgi:hypothetical protein
VLQVGQLDDLSLQQLNIDQCALGTDVGQMAHLIIIHAVIRHA